MNETQKMDILHKKKVEILAVKNENPEKNKQLNIEKNKFI